MAVISEREEDLNENGDEILENESGGEENENNEDPGENDPKARILWAAQNNNIELVTTMLQKSPGTVQLYIFMDVNTLEKYFNVKRNFLVY